MQDIQTFIRDKKGWLFIRTFEGDSFDEPLEYLISADPIVSLLVHAQMGKSVPKRTTSKMVFYDDAEGSGSS